MFFWNVKNMMNFSKKIIIVLNHLGREFWSDSDKSGEYKIR